MIFKVKKQLTVLLLLSFIGLPQFSAGMISPALPIITNSLNIEANLAQLTVSIYFLGFALGVLFWGILADKIGRRHSILMGVFVFIISCIGCAISYDIYWLIAFRMFNGFGASAGSVSSTLIRDHFKDDVSRNKMMATMAMGLALCPALGTMIGGYSARYLEWYDSFWILSFVGSAVLTFGYIKMPETVDVAKLRENKVIIFKVFKKIIKDRRVINCSIVIAGFNAMLHGAMNELPFIAQNILGMPADMFGYLGLFTSISTMFGAYWARKLSAEHENSYRIMLFGCGLASLASLLLLFFSYSGVIVKANYLFAVITILITLLIFFAAFGLTMPLTLSAALVKYQKVQGTAGALFGFSYYILISTFLELIRFLHDGTPMALPIYMCIISGVLLVSIRFLKKEFIKI